MKSGSKKLALNRETIRALSVEEMQKVAGGARLQSAGDSQGCGNGTGTGGGTGTGNGTGTGTHTKVAIFRLM
jgi:natural product precursor